MKSRLMSASICVNDLIEHLKAGHYAFNKAGNEKTYVNLAIWINENEPDQYGNHASISLAKPKEKKEDKTVYVGNGKFYQNSPSEPTKNDVSDLTEGLPF